jgi:tetratricopeptide (TPR) repeat protein
LETALCAVDTRHAEATVDTDLSMIRDAISRSTGGFERMNQTVISRLQKWLLASAKAALLAETPGVERAAGRLHNRVVRLLLTTGALDEGARWAEEHVAARSEVFGSTHMRTLDALNQHGLVLRALGRAADAAAVLSRAHAAAMASPERGPDHLDTLAIALNLAELRFTDGRLDEAETLYRDALTRNTANLGVDDSQTAVVASHLGELLVKREALVEALPLLRNAVDSLSKSLGARHNHTLIARQRLASALVKQGSEDEAQEILMQVHSVFREHSGPLNERTLVAATDLGGLMRHRGDLAGAVALLRETTAGLACTLGDAHANTRACSLQFARALQQAGELQEALDRFVACAGALRAEQDVSMLPHALDYAASTARMLDDLPRSEALYREAHEAAVAAVAAASSRAATSAGIDASRELSHKALLTLALADVLAMQEDTRTEAVDWYRDAVAELPMAYGEHSPHSSTAKRRMDRLVRYLEEQEEAVEVEQPAHALAPQALQF